MKDAWDPGRYERFKAERSAPFFDLLNGIARRPGMRVVDLGCGTGELTRVAHVELGAEETIGVDRSEAMLARARGVVGPGLRFEQGDLADVLSESIPPWLSGRPFDLILSNAALHWVPDHDRLLARLTERLSEGGQLAVQIPANSDHPAHVAAAEVAREAPFRGALAGYEHRTPVLAPEHYATLLHRLGYSEQRVRLEVYAHRLASRDDVAEWLRGSLLTAYAERLPPELFAAFLDRYRARLVEVLPDERPYLLTYKRILFWGKR